MHSVSRFVFMYDTMIVWWLFISFEPYISELIYDISVIIHTYIYILILISAF
jgi:hypothetical protein